MVEDHWNDRSGDGVGDLPIPTLMRGARGAYAQAIRSELAAIGVDDLPRNGAAVLFGILGAGGASTDRGPRLPAQLGVSKQAVSQLLEVLVDRGYVRRDKDANDGRRVALTVTGRGQEAIDAVERAVTAVDEELAAAVSTSELVAFRKALAALAQVKSSRVERGVSSRRPKRGGMRAEPVFPVRDLVAARLHYESLGFDTSAFDDGYGFAAQQGATFHLAVEAGHDPGRAVTAYLHVADADTLQAAWSQPGIGGRTGPVEDTPWGMREGAHTDPDGNLIRFGSPLRR